MSQSLTFTIKAATTPEDLASVRTLFKAYASSLPVDLSYQNFDDELSTLPGSYTPPTGCLLLATSTLTEESIGCVALRPLPGSSAPGTSCLGPRSNNLKYDPLEPTMKVAEMKRLYCIAESRGSGVGRSLVEELLREAVGFGYEEVRLDTLPSMAGARRLYEALGFREVERYYDTPIEGTVFLGKRLVKG